MKHFLQLGAGVRTIDVLAELHRQPDLWDAEPGRREMDGTPHAGMTDIWLRYSKDKRQEAHFPVWYPAWNRLPSLHPLVYGALAAVRGVMLGGVLITRIPPGGKIDPHVDGGWHAKFFNTKVYIVLLGNEKCFYQIGEEKCFMKTGDSWTFSNQKMHSVENQGEDYRITLIICVRCEP